MTELVKLIPENFKEFAAGTSLILTTLMTEITQGLNEVEEANSTGGHISTN